MSEKVFKPIIPYFLPFRSLCFLIHAPTYDCKEKEKTFKRGLDKLEILLSEMIRESSNINDLYTLVNNVALPFSILFIMPVFMGGEFENKIREIKTNMKGLKIKELMVSNVVLGSLCYRRFDKEQTYGYERLKEIGKQLQT
jgi:hypothetical protein